MEEKSMKQRWELIEEIAVECYPKLSESNYWICFEDNRFGLDGYGTLDDLKLIVKAAEEFQRRVNELEK